MNVYPVHVIPMRLVTTLMVALAVIALMAILEMAFNVLVGARIYSLNQITVIKQYL